MFYSFFPLVHLVIVFLRVFVLSGPEAETVEAFAKRDISGLNSKNELKSFILLSEATNALFGGASISDIAIKFISRGLPLITAPLRVRLAFVIRQASVAAYRGTAHISAVPTSAEEETGVNGSSAPPEPPTNKPQTYVCTNEWWSYRVFTLNDHA